MENSKKQKFVDRKYQLLFWTIGMILLLITFICSKQLDEKNCEKRMATTIDFLKSQTNNYKRYNDTEIAKVLFVKHWLCRHFRIVIYRRLKKRCEPK